MNSGLLRKERIHENVLEKNFKLIGEIATLMMKSKIHSQFSINSIGHVILPAIQTNQYRIYRNRQHYPVAYVSWARVTPEIEDKFLHKKYVLQPEDWKSGERIVFVDFMAPFGHTKQVVRDLRKSIFIKEKEAKFLRFDDIGKPRRVYHLRKK